MRKCHYHVNNRPLFLHRTWVRVLKRYRPEADKTSESTATLKCHIDMSYVQCLLPPITPIIRRRISLRRRTNIQDLHSSFIPIYWERRHSRPVWISPLCKVRDIFLECYCSLGTNDHHRIGPVIICIGNVGAMDCGRDGEVVAISVVSKRLVQVESVASKDHFRDLGCGSSDLSRVRLGLRAVEDWWIERVRDIR